jgi:hypothetical protein
MLKNLIYMHIYSARCTRRCTLTAQESGYRSIISSLDPMNCTPKNNLLVGLPPSRAAAIAPASVLLNDVL